MHLVQQATSFLIPSEYNFTVGTDVILAQIMSMINTHYRRNFINADYSVVPDIFIVVLLNISYRRWPPRTRFINTRPSTSECFHPFVDFPVIHRHISGTAQMFKKSQDSRPSSQSIYDYRHSVSDHNLAVDGRWPCHSSADQSVACFSLRWAGCDPRTVHEGFVVDKVALRQVSLEVVGFPLLSWYRRLSIRTHLSYGDWEMGWRQAGVPIDIVSSHHMYRNKTQAIGYIHASASFTPSTYRKPQSRSGGD
jgi:hypothetical protein